MSGLRRSRNAKNVNGLDHIAIKQEQSLRTTNLRTSQTGMSQFRAKRLDLGGFINPRIIRDHTKRKVFEQFEQERYAPCASWTGLQLHNLFRVSTELITCLDKPCDMSLEIPRSHNDCDIRHSCNYLRCIAIQDLHKSRIDV